MCCDGEGTVYCVGGGTVYCDGGRTVYGEGTYVQCTMMVEVRCVVVEGIKNIVMVWRVTVVEKTVMYTAVGYTVNHTETQTLYNLNKS